MEDETTQQNLSQIAVWVMAQPFKEIAKSSFLAGADPWLIAKAKTIGATVVTQETLDPKCKIRVKIPNVCLAGGVPSIDTFTLLQRLGANFTFAGGSR